MDLRRRRSTPSSSTRSSSSEPEANGGLSARRMISHAQHHGPVLKLHQSLWLTLLPTTLRTFLLKLFSCLRPTWKERYLMIVGSFLYKFRDASSTSPKGAPIPLESLRVVPHDDDRKITIDAPPGYTVLWISTFRQDYYYAVRDDEVLLWRQTLSDARMECRKRDLGHVPPDSYPREWDYYDKLGAASLRSKNRIRERVQEMEMQELSEWSTTSRGVFG